MRPKAVRAVGAGQLDGNGLELAEFKELKNPLIARKAALEQQLTKIEKGFVSPIEPLKNLIFEANQAQKWVLQNN